MTIVYLIAAAVVICGCCSSSCGPALVTDDASPRRLLATERVVSAAQQGDPRAIATLLSGSHAHVRRFARTLCSTPEDAEDAAQEALIVLYRKIGTLRATAALASWMFQIVRNECIRRSRLAFHKPVHRRRGRVLSRRRRARPSGDAADRRLHRGAPCRAARCPRAARHPGTVGSGDGSGAGPQPCRDEVTSASWHAKMLRCRTQSAKDTTNNGGTEDA